MTRSNSSHSGRPLETLHRAAQPAAQRSSTSHRIMTIMPYIVDDVRARFVIMTRGDAPAAAITDGARKPAPGDVEIEPGTLADYRALAQFHYRSAHPGGVTDVLRMQRRGLTVVGRFLHRREERQLVGVLVRSLPSLSCQLRDIATQNRYSHLDPRERAVMLNREVRCISRVVIDPRMRGMGLAVRLVRHALANPGPGILFTEALAAMGRVSPFFEKAGMTRYERPVRARADHARLIDALARVGITPPMLASQVIVHNRLAEMTDCDRRWLDAELRRWRRASQRIPSRKLKTMSTDDLLRQARDEVLLAPVYFAFSHKT